MQNFTETTSTNHAADVVKSDKQRSPAEQLFGGEIAGTNQAIFMLERFEQDRIGWEKTELAASHKRLYQILANCYEFYLVMKTDKDSTVRDQYKNALIYFASTRGYMKLDETHTMNIIVKCVFDGKDRRRVSAYSLALRAALTGGTADKNGKGTPVPATGLADWLSDQGGVEEVRLGGKNKGLTAKERATIAKTALKNTALMTFKPEANCAEFDTNDVDMPVLLVVTYRPNGELDVSAIVKEPSAVNAALAAHYSKNKDAVQAAADKATIPPQVSAINAVMQKGFYN